MKEGLKKTVLVSAGLGYLGEAVVKDLVARGFIVAFLYRASSEEKKKEFLLSFPEGSAHAFMCDCKSEENVQTVFSRIDSELGPIFGIIDTIGVPFNRGQSIGLAGKDFLSYFQDAFIPSSNILLEGARYLKQKNDGVLIGVTTIGVVRKEATKGMGVYMPSKFALHGLLSALHEELRNSHISVHAVMPGILRGGLNKAFPKAFFDMYLQMSDTKKETTREAVATTISQLCERGGVDGSSFEVPVANEFLMN